MHGYLTCLVRVSVRLSPLTTTATGPADCSQPCGQLRRPDHTTMAPGMQICCNHSTCLCLPWWRYVPAKSGTGMQLLPSVLNDKFGHFHTDASTLVRETAARIFGKRGASDSYNVSSTQAGSASRMTTNPRVKRRPCRPDCRFIPTWYSAKISMLFCFVITGDFFSVQRRHLST